MKAILSVVAILAAGAGAYFSFDYSQKFKVLQTEFEQIESSNKELIKKAEVAEKEVKAETVKLVAANDKKTLLTQTVDSLNSTASALKNEFTKSERDLKAQESEFAEVNKVMEEVKNTIGKLGPDITLESLPDKIKEIDDNKAMKIKRLEELEALAKGANVSIANNRAEIDRLTKKVIERGSRISRNSMEAVITAVNQEWGFVVIGAGTNSGFTPKTVLLVERDGRSIGRVSPSSIEPNQTIAEIDLESLASGVRIQPGDRVILAKPLAN